MFKKHPKEIDKPYLSKEVLSCAIPLMLMQARDTIPDFEINKSILTEKLSRGVNKLLSDFVAEQEQEKILLIKKLNIGGFDEYIFGKKPQSTRELQIIIKHDSRSFIQHLFAKCEPKENFVFWLKQEVKLPSDSLALAVALGSKKFVFEYLYDNKLLPEKINETEKINFLTRSDKLDKEALDYVKEIFDINSNNYLVKM